MRHAFFIVALSTLVACGGDTEVDLFVDLRTDLLAGSEFDLARVELREVSPGETWGEAIAREAEVPTRTGQAFSAGGRVAEFSAVPTGPYVLRVQLYRGTAIIATRTVALEVATTRALVVVITRTCADVECPSSGGGGVSCLSGRCVAATCVEGHEVSCGEPECSADADCAAGAACATHLCVEGACLFQLADSECPEAELCHPEDGCLGVEECVPAPETCDGTDEDCDELIDEDFDLESDPARCGACDRACPAGPSGTATCTAGECGIACDPGFGDCDGDPANGCERDLGTATDCGACDAVCPTGEPACSPTGAGTFECVSGCPSDAPTLCGSSCVSTSSDRRHCGGCGVACDNDHGTSECLSGSCEITSCDTPYMSCDGDATTGCETPACGDCDMACSAPNVATYRCSSGMCTSSSCVVPFGNCDAAYANGCEIDLSTDMMHCGGCRRACAPENATGSCSAGTCSLVSCDPGYTDCNRDIADGCEAHFDDDEENCGGCGIACAMGETCTGGRCNCYATAGTIGGGAVCTGGLVCGNLERTCCAEGCPCSRFGMAPPCPPPSP